MGSRIRTLRSGCERDLFRKTAWQFLRVGCGGIVPDLPRMTRIARILFGVICAIRGPLSPTTVCLSFTELSLISLGGNFEALYQNHRSRYRVFCAGSCGSEILRLASTDYATTLGDNEDGGK